MIVDFREYIGNKFTTNEGYVVEIIDYIDRNHVLIKFEERPELHIRGQSSRNVRHFRYVWLHLQAFQVDYEGLIAQDASAGQSL